MLQLLLLSNKQDVNMLTILFTMSLISMALDL